MQIYEQSSYACTFGNLKTVLYKYAFSDQERMNDCGRLKIEDIPYRLDFKSFQVSSDLD